VLAGRSDPSGRLPVSFPGATANQPATYLGAGLTRASQVSSVDPSPLFPFGHGLSYFPVRWGEVQAASSRWATDGTVELTVGLGNDADTAAREVVQVYVHDPVAEVARPVQQLVAVAAVEVPAGEQRSVRLRLHADLCSYTGRDGTRRVDPGDVELRVGRSSEDVVARIPLTMTGPVRRVGADRELFASAVIGD
jgi:beta-glucosidase